MIINSIYIENFGGISQLSLDFDNGFNMIYGSNEAGKSTIMAFVKLMFYGSAKSTRGRYQPLCGQAMKGHVVFTHDGRTYRLEKTFGKTTRTDKVKLLDDSTGEEITVNPKEDIGETFFDMSLGSFEKSVFIEGMGGFAKSGDTSDEIASRLMGMESADAEVAMEQVVKRLEDEKYKYVSKSGRAGAIVELKQRKEKLDDEIARCEDERERQSGLYGEMDECRNRQAEVDKLISVRRILDQKKNLEVQINACNDALDQGRGIIADMDSLCKGGLIFDEIGSYVEDCRRMRLNIKDRESQLDPDPVAVDEDYVNRFKEILDELSFEKQKSETVVEVARAACQEASDAYKPSYKTVFKVIGALALICAATATLFLPMLIVAAILGVAAFLFRIQYERTKKDFEIKQEKYKNLKEENDAAIEALGRSRDDIQRRYNVHTYDELVRLLAKWQDTRAKTEEIKELKDQYEIKLCGRDIDSLAAGYEDVKERRLKFEGVAAHLLGHGFDSMTGYINALSDKVSLLGSELGSQQIALSRLGALSNTDIPETGQLEREKADVSARMIAIARQLKPEVDLKDLKDELAEVNEDLARKEFLHEAIGMAHETMKTTMDEINASFGPLLNERTREILSCLTGARYNMVNVSKDFSMSVRGNDTSYIGWNFLSSGTLDQAYLALRLALSDLLTDGNDELPLMIDDVLLQYDDDREKYAMRELFERSNRTQVIFFTCKQYLREIIDENNINFIQLAGN